MKMYVLAHLIVLMAVHIRESQGATVTSGSTTLTLGSQDTCYCLHDVLGTALYNPVNVVFYRDSGSSSDHIMVVEQRGVVKEYPGDRDEESGGQSPKQLLDISDRVVVTSDYGESRGLLSVVRDPNFDANGRVFAYYITEDEGEEYAYVSRFTASSSGVIDPATELIMFRVHQPFKHGNGGPMLFGTDGYLYVVTGDGGEEDDPQGYAQSLDTFHGKVLRLDVSGRQDFTDGPSGLAKTFAVPEDNPFVNMSTNVTALPEIFALGFRNMWGCSQDSRPGGSGRIFCAETGTDQFDEINVIEAGKNYGWNLKEGSACHDSRDCGNIENEGVPIYNFAHVSAHALVGGYVYRGADVEWASGHGFYTFGDVVDGKTYLLQERDNGTWTRFDWPVCSDVDSCPSHAKERPLAHLFAFGQDTTGELYLAMADDLVPTTQTAKLFKIVAADVSASTRLTPSPAYMAVLALLLLHFGRSWK